MKRTLRVLLVRWRFAIAGDATYRADFVMGFVVAAIWLGFAIAPMLVLFDHVEQAGDWTLARLLLLQAIWYLLDAVMWLWVLYNIGYWREMVQTGRLDAILLRPVDSLTMASFGSINSHNLPKLIPAALLGGGAFLFGEEPASAVALAAGVVTVVSAAALLWGFAVLLNAKTLTSVRFDASFGIHTAHNLARVPVEFYGRVMRVLLTVVVPIAFLTTVPAEVVFGSASPWFAAVSLVVASVVVVLARAAWSHQLRRYVGAMS